MTGKDKLLDSLNSELSILNERIRLATTFISKDGFNKLSVLQQKLLKAQLAAMDTYSGILDLRINDIEDDSSDDKTKLIDIDRVIDNLDDDGQTYWIKFNDTNLGYLNIYVDNNEPTLDNNIADDDYLNKFTKSQIKLLRCWNKLGSEPFNWEHAQILATNED